MEKRPEVHRLEGRISNFYLCVDEEALLLIDAGMPKEEGLVFEKIAQLGYEPADLSRILITHADIDHVGSLAAIQAKSGATVFAGEQTAEFLVQAKSPKHLPWLLQRLSDAFFKYQPVPGDCLQVIRDGEKLPVWAGMQALATPGHTPDHFAFYSPGTGYLFAGDALNTRNGRLQRSPKFLTADEEAANCSAIRLLELAPATIACGHGLPLKDHEVDDLMNLFDELRSGA